MIDFHNHVLPNVDDGLHIMKFINAAVESSNNNAKWINIFENRF